jgi:hypothetical protein
MGNRELNHSAFRAFVSILFLWILNFSFTLLILSSYFQFAVSDYVCQWLTLVHWNTAAMKVTTGDCIHNRYLTRPRQKIFAYIVCTRLVGAPDVLRTWQVYVAGPHLMRLISLKVNDSPRQHCIATGPPPIRSRTWELLDCFCAVSLSLMRPAHKTATSGLTLHFSVQKNLTKLVK